VAWKIKRLVIFFCTGLHRRVNPVSPGIARSRETGKTGANRGSPAVSSGTNKMTSRFIHGRYLYRTVNRSPAGHPEKTNKTYPLALALLPPQSH